MQTKSGKKIYLEIETANLAPAQTRLLGTVCHAMYEALVAKDESEYFNSSAEVLRMCASLIKQSNFGKQKEMPYSDQALEYSLEMLQDYISTSRLIAYDN